MTTNDTNPTARKPHRDFAGYRCELRNPYSGGHTIILDCKEAAEQGAPLIDNWRAEGRYQVLCNEHAQVENVTALPIARKLMKDPTTFCTECRAIAGES
jgi:hypothetical protein